MKKNWSFIILLLFTFVILSSGGCGCGGCGCGGDDEKPFKDTFKEYSSYDLWTFPELEAEYEKASKHPADRAKIEKKRIVLEGEIEKVAKTFGNVAVTISQPVRKKGFLMDSMGTGTVTCYFKNNQADIDDFETNGWLIVEGRIEASGILMDCKIITSLTAKRAREIKRDLEYNKINR